MVKSQFNYCPLVWMFRSRQSNNLINKIHERSVRSLSLSLSLSLRFKVTNIILEIFKYS